MSGTTSIEWTDATWNPVGGCSVKSPGCKPCYAMGLAGTRLRNLPLYRGTTDKVKGKHVFNGTMTAVPDDHPEWTFPLRWRGTARPRMGAGKPSLIFAGDMSDVCHEDRPGWAFRRMLAIAALSPHIVQFLTKRPDVMAAHIADIVGTAPPARSYRCPAWHGLLNRVEREWCGDTGRTGRYDEVVRPRLLRAAEMRGAIDVATLPNVWLGFSAERQREFDERWPYMRILAQAGWTIFLSYEPAIGPIELPAGFLVLGKRAQVIAGGMSGRDATPSHPDWFRHVRDQCAAAGVAFLFKQWGEWGPHEPPTERDLERLQSAGRIYGELIRIGKRAAGRLLDGVQHDGFPAIGETA